MQKNIYKKVFILIQVIIPVFLSAQIPAGYYDAANGKKKVDLKTALHNIISTGYVTKSYDFLFTIYETSDNTASGNVWDMYSTCVWTHGDKKCGNYKYVCDCYNREHSIPQSWFDSKSPMVSDAFHIYPTDGKVNGQRSNYPFGECAIGTSLDNRALGRLGKSTFSGYSGTVFEPDDEYKGDFARTYFYFATRYQNIMTSIDGESFNRTTYPSLSAWSINLFLKWHRQDPVSQKEIDRNNAIYVYQKNRNPFIDYPELAEHIWGDKMDVAFDLNGSGIDEKTNNQNIYINYNNNLFEIYIDNADGDIQIYTLTGELFYTQKAYNGINYIPVDKNNLYIIRIGSFVSKIIAN